MNARKIIIVVALLAVPFVCGAAIFGWTANAVLAQGPWQGGNYTTLRNNQALWQLLKSDPDTVWQQRQSGKSLLEIATSKGISEQALLDTLLQPMTEMHARMQQQYPQTDTTTMTAAMRQQFSQDIRVAQYGTMTDMHLFGMNGAFGMMGMMNGGNGYGGMMQNGMMHGNSGYGGMMNGGMMNGGMMHGNGNAPFINTTPVPSSQKADREITITAQTFKFAPTVVTVKKGETVKFSFVNQDNFAHNVLSYDGKLPYTVLPANQTATVLWAAPSQAGTYNFICTWHPKMELAVTVE